MGGEPAGERRLLSDPAGPVASVISVRYASIAGVSDLATMKALVVELVGLGFEAEARSDPTDTDVILIDAFRTEGVTPATLSFVARSTFPAFYDAAYRGIWRWEPLEDDFDTFVCTGAIVLPAAP